MIRHVVVYIEQRAFVDRQTLAVLTGRSVHTIRARCRIVGHKDGKALYDAEECEVQLAEIPTRRPRVRVDQAA